MSSEDGQEWGGYIEQPGEEPTAPQPPPPAAAPSGSEPPQPPPPGGRGGGPPPWMRGPWRYVIALVGVAAIAGGVVAAVSSGGGKHTTTTTSTSTTHTHSTTSSTTSSTTTPSSTSTTTTTSTTRTSSGASTSASSTTSTTSSTAGTGLSKQAYISAADSVCGRLNPPVEQAYSTYATDFQNGNIAGAEAAAVQFQEGAAAELTALRALGLPTEGGATVEQLLSLEQELITDLESGTPQSEIVQQARVVSQQIASLAQQYGFKVCGVT